MNAAKVIVSYRKCHGIFEMFQFFRKPQGQAGQSPVEQPEAQMCPVNI